MSTDDRGEPVYRVLVVRRGFRPYRIALEGALGRRLYAKRAAQQDEHNMHFGHLKEYHTAREAEDALKKAESEGAVHGVAYHYGFSKRGFRHGEAKETPPFKHEFGKLPDSYLDFT